MAKMLNRNLVWGLTIIIICFTALLAAWLNKTFSASSIHPVPNYERKLVTQDLPNRPLGKNVNYVRENLCQPLRFYNTSPAKDAPPLTALHSFPGSGNTWIRHLLHQATGVYTGNRHISKVLTTQTEFLGDMRHDRSVLCIKTHLRADSKYARAVILIRNPKDAILAEFNRQNSGKVQRPSSEMFETDAWRHFVSKQMERYSPLLRSWIHDFKGRKFIVFYEDLKNDLLTTLNGVVRFLTGTDIPNTVKRCILRNGEGAFLRKGSIDFDPYSSVRDLIPKLNQMKTQLWNEVQECVKAGRCDGG